MLDSSIPNGLEMISQPATFNYHLSKKEGYENLFNFISEMGYKSHSLSSCGLHIHFNKTFYGNNVDLCTINLLYLVEKYWKDIVLLSRRNYNSLVRYADKYYQKPEEVLHTIKSNRYYHNMRYHAVNLTNDNTIEFRMYRGTLLIDDFLATLEFTRNLILAAKDKTPIEIQQVDIMDLVNTSKNLLKYYKKCHRKTALARLPKNFNERQSIYLDF